MCRLFAEIHGEYRRLRPFDKAVPIMALMVVVSPASWHRHLSPAPFPVEKSRRFGVEEKRRVLRATRDSGAKRGRRGRHFCRRPYTASGDARKKKKAWKIFLKAVAFVGQIILSFSAHILLQGNNFIYLGVVFIKVQNGVFRYVKTSGRLKISI